MEKKTLLIASDHAGFNLKKYLIENVPAELNIEFLDLGPASADRVDYPDFAKKLCKKMLSENFERGVLICGSGIGMSMTANRFKGIRAALVETVKSAELSRLHNDSNVLCLGERIIDENLAQKILKVWINTEFEGARHTARVEKIEIDQ